MGTDIHNRKQNFSCLFLATNANEPVPFALVSRASGVDVVVRSENLVHITHNLDRRGPNRIPHSRQDLRFLYQVLHL